MELMIIVALVVLSVALGLAGTRAILGLMFSVMMRARTAHDITQTALEGIRS
jgi:hypothetical protein